MRIDDACDGDVRGSRVGFGMGFFGIPKSSNTAKT